MNNSSVASLEKLIESLRKVQSLQAKRANVYHELSTAFKQFMSTSQPDSTHVQAYTLACQSVTSQFSKISQSVRSIIEQQQNVDNNDRHVQMLQKLQTLEKSKLELTVTIQSLQRQIALERFVIDQDEMHEKSHASSSSSCKHHNCSLHSHGGDDDEKGEKGSETIRGEKLAYLENDLQKLKSSLRVVVEQINELLEEIMYELDDLTQSLEDKREEEKKNPVVATVTIEEKASNSTTSHAASESGGDQGIFL